ncbi:MULTISPECIES: MarR family winged helix-turn-helix transcriptional regulator [Streptomycetaceae]|uniref:HTH marR-type domain-containing protein n=1 Tax=Streptantibioticus cattleyicolor (strain ATCC 35852 / DSM 46488 / JCM 4925 / NBRC 14057 / NRRL 8057) TaxID=1003195 RepID=F8JUZ6_STREN|nr:MULTISPECIES: MarR family transcriptional regulator [Streptomycetaceae]AEW98161.1 hypothetical protein SCATT_57900 [Streptantibioticus cattleyicolor NRRL 8057 = DSM 46488]MYS62547.1 MarR family transcriptional regulator [Streptomyces sp. SID5468]CCB78476.1 conserved protein of unknown function [Streptantibioticus cattleyicolor NRRL 8057 = DSM 46488]
MAPPPKPTTPAPPAAPAPRPAPAPRGAAVTELAARTTALAAALDEATTTALAPTGLTRADYDVLAALHRTGPPHRLKPTDITAACHLSSGGTSNVLRRLATSGYITREADAHDGRSTWVELTPEGHHLTTQALTATTTAHTRLLAHLPPDTLTTLTTLLRQALHP